MDIPGKLGYNNFAGTDNIINQSRAIIMSILIHMG